MSEATIDSKEMIIVEQLPIITEKLINVSLLIEERVNHALSLDVTETTLSEVKKVRAGLNKDKADLENRRKDVKKAVMDPYSQFETVYKDLVLNKFTKADTELKSKISNVENGIKRKKREKVEQYFNEYAQSKDINFISFTDAKCNVTLSASVKSLKEGCKDFIDSISAGLELIETQDHKDEILVEFKKNLNAAVAITTVVNRYKAIGEEKARREAAKAQKEQKKEAVKKVEAIQAETVPVVDDSQEIVILNLRVKATKEKLRALKTFLLQGGYEIE